MSATFTVGPSVRQAKSRTAAVSAFLAAAVLWGGSSFAAEPAVERQQKVHAGLYELATSTEDETLWVAATGSSLAPGARLVALDPITLEEECHIELGEDAAYGVAINNRTQKLYSSNTRAGNMSVVDLRTGEVTIIDRADIEGAPHLYRVVVDEENNMIYSSVASTPGTIWVVNGATDQLEHIIENVGARPTGLALDTDANRLYASLLDDNEIAVIDLESREVVDRIPTLGERSTQLAFDAATKRLFVGNQDTNDVTVIDTRRGRAIRQIPAGTQPVGVAFHPKTNRLYVASRQDGVVKVIDGETYELIADLEIGTNPNTIHIDVETGLVYVTNKAARSPRGQPPTEDPNGDMVTLIQP